MTDKKEEITPFEFLNSSKATCRENNISSADWLYVSVLMTEYADLQSKDKAIGFKIWCDKLHPSSSPECYVSDFPGLYIKKSNDQLYEIFTKQK